MKLSQVLQSRKARRYGQRGTPGARPGSIEIHPEAKPAKIHITSYGPDGIEQQSECTVDQIQEIMGKRAVTWIDIVGIGSTETFEQVGSLLGLHRLALSDVAHVPQRPKVEDYPEQIFLVAQVPMTGTAGETGQVSFFLGKDYVLSWQEFPGREFVAVRERLQHTGRPIRQLGADYLLYALVDAAVDAFFPKLGQLGDQLDELEEQIYDNADTSMIVELHSLRRQVRHLRSVMWPLREAVSSLMSNHEWMISKDVSVYLRDCHDHTVQVIDTLELYRESCSDLRDYYNTEVSNRLNEVMKVLTIIATIFIPLSFIAGVYGMNFDPEVSKLNMPELKYRWGYPMVLGLMAAVAVGQLLFFRWRGWLGDGLFTKSKRQK